MGDGPNQTDEDTRELVAALLAAAQLDPPAQEIDRLAALYPGLQASIDRFHQIDAGDEVTAAVFRVDDRGDTGRGGRAS